MLKLRFTDYKLECGTDEAGRGCLAGPVTAASVLLPDNFNLDLLNDSKQLSETWLTFKLSLLRIKPCFGTEYDFPSYKNSPSFKVPIIGNKIK